MRIIAKRALGGMCLVFLMLSGGAFGTAPRTANTFALEEGEDPPGATLEDASWMVGSWTGTAFGKRFEETWGAPSAGSMLGMWKLMGDEGVDFYELMLLTVDEGSLSLKVKHFSADFVAWEEKPDFVNFKLVKKEPDALHFAGISFYRRDADHIDAYIVMKDGEEITEHELKYVRLKR
jgi:hypothetical protein